MQWVVLSFGFTFIFSLILINRADAWGFVDAPEARKVHTVPTPRTGGLAMICGTLATFAVYLSARNPWPPIPWQTIAAGTGFMSLGILDDRFGFHPKGKIWWFLLLALLAAWPWAFSAPAGTPYLVHLGESTTRIPSLAAFLILTCWFFAVPNAVNIEDAINGYMGGFTLILLGVTALLGVNVLLVIGALLSFLVLNWPRAKHFLGDAGSFGCGFAIAEAILRAGGNHRPLLAVVLTAPISMDVCMGFIRRARLKMSMLEADRATCPHHVVNLCNQSHALATPLLWANTVVVAFLGFRHPVLEAVYLFFFACALILLNRAPLFRPQAANQPNR